MGPILPETRALPSGTKPAVSPSKVPLRDIITWISALVVPGLFYMIIAVNDLQKQAAVMEGNRFTASDGLKLMQEQDKRHLAIWREIGTIREALAPLASHVGPDEERMNILLGQLSDIHERLAAIETELKHLRN